MNVRERKRALRAQFRKYRTECSPELKREMDRKLYESFVSIKEFSD